MREELRQIVEAIVPVDTREDQDRAVVLDWIASGAELCRLKKPATPEPHLVVYFVLMDGAHVLLGDHRTSGLWLPSGGHVEPGEHPAETVRREAREELAIEVTFAAPHPLFVTVQPTVGPDSHRDVTLWYALKGDRDVTPWFDPAEYSSIRWFAHEDIPVGKSDPALGRFLQKCAMMETA